MNIPYADAGSGEFGANIHNTLYWTSDSDWCFGFRDSSILQRHQLSGRGSLQLQVDVQTLETRNWGQIWDEWGWSNISLFQQCRPYARLIYPFQSPPVTTNVMAFSQYAGGGFFYQDTNNSDHAWSFRHCPAGNHQHDQVGIPGTLEANSWALVMIGVQTANSTWTNDTSVDSNVMGRYRLARVGIRHV